MPYWKSILFFLLLLTLPQISHANAGIPMIAITEPLFLLLFIPIVMIEYYFERKILPNYKKRTLKRAIIISNAVSTLVGLPLTWLILVIIQLRLIPSGIPYNLEVLVSFPWIGPNVSNFFISILLLLIPFFFTSYWVEYWVARRILKVPRKTIEDRDLRKAVWKGNIYSYLFLATFAGIVIGIWMVIIS